jgi:hypothetical protein
VSEALVLNGRYDTPAIRDGAIQYIKCGNCGAEPGEPCFLAITKDPLMGFAHIARRMDYYDWQDIFGPASQTWEWSLEKHTAKELARKRFHERAERLRPCSQPRSHCEKCSWCGCGALLSDHDGYAPPAEKKSNSADVDDLLG